MATARIEEGYAPVEAKGKEVGMESEAGNVAILRKAYEKWNDTKGGSIPLWLSILTEDVDFRSLADGVEPLDFTRRRTTRNDVADYLTALVNEWQMIDFTIDEYVAEADRVVAIGSCSFRHRTQSQVFTTPKIDIWRFRDGKGCEFFEYYDTHAVIAPGEKPVESRVVRPTGSGARAIGDPRPRPRNRAKEQGHVAMPRSAYRRWSDSKAAAISDWAEMMADDIDFRSVGAGADAMAFTRARPGKAEATAYLTTLAEQWAMVDYAMNDFIAEGDRVVAVGECAWTFKATGKTVRTPKVDLWRIANDRAVAFFELFDTNRAFAATGPD